MTKVFLLCRLQVSALPDRYPQKVQKVEKGTESVLRRLQVYKSTRLQVSAALGFA